MRTLADVLQAEQVDLSDITLSSSEVSAEMAGCHNMRDLG